MSISKKEVCAINSAAEMLLAATEGHEDLFEGVIVYPKNGRACICLWSSKAIKEIADCFGRKVEKTVFSNGKWYREVVEIGGLEFTHTGAVEEA